MHNGSSSARTRHPLRLWPRIALVACFLAAATTVVAEKITLAAAADLKFAMDEISAAFRRENPGDEVDVVYGSSGKFSTQIQQGAPYDLFFSADIAYPRQLVREGFAGSEVKPYAIGRIVLWSPSTDATSMTLADLTWTTITRIAIANPRHAPYGKRAAEALQAAGVWERLEPKLVYGESVAHTAQVVQSGNAQVGIIALSLALNPELASKGGYSLIPGHLHGPLEQGFIVTRRAEKSAPARRFAEFMGSASARAVMTKYGFVLPGEIVSGTPKR